MHAGRSAVAVAATDGGTATRSGWRISLKLLGLLTSILDATCTTKGGLLMTKLLSVPKNPYVRR
jgi:hypothetical protein